MNQSFNHNQFHEDMNDLLKFLKGFGKSFGPSAKKVKGTEIGIFEELYIRFRLSLVEMGISKIIRTVIAIIVGVFIFLPLFLKSQMDMKVIFLFLFIVFYAWLMMDHLVVDEKPVDTTAKIIVGVHEFGVSLWEGIKDFFGGVFGALNPFKKEEAKK